MEKIKLNESDWEILMAGKGVKLGNTVLVVRPFSLEKIAKLKVMLKTLILDLQERGISAENIDDPDSLTVIFDYVVTNCPALIEEACGLDREDVPKLPIGAGITLIAEIINVNLDSQEGLFDALSFLGKLMTK